MVFRIHHIQLLSLSPKWISWHCLRMELWLKVLPYPLCSQGSFLPWNPRCLISPEHCLKVFYFHYVLTVFLQCEFSNIQWALLSWKRSHLLRLRSVYYMWISWCHVVLLLTSPPTSRDPLQMNIRMFSRMGAPREVSCIHNKDVLSNMTTIKK